MTMHNKVQRFLDAIAVLTDEQLDDFLAQLELLLK